MGIKSRNNVSLHTGYPHSLQTAQQNRAHERELSVRQASELLVGV